MECSETRGLSSLLFDFALE